ncbi:hypothetical protein V502_05461 [Pseudogymnoascus sp. VKM F-4520 (FW-2644)]|nr:hypothetical protein V502_05461 [Pseudogymnoascus sp. VKM F-4520 (FW-2644)]
MARASHSQRRSIEQQRGNPSKRPSQEAQPGRTATTSPPQPITNAHGSAWPPNPSAHHGTALHPLLPPHLANLASKRPLARAERGDTGTPAAGPIMGFRRRNLLCLVVDVAKGASSSSNGRCDVERKGHFSRREQSGIRDEPFDCGEAVLLDCPFPVPFWPAPSEDGAMGNDRFERCLDRGLSESIHVWAP